MAHRAAHRRKTRSAVMGVEWQTLLQVLAVVVLARVLKQWFGIDIPPMPYGP